MPFCQSIQPLHHFPLQVSFISTTRNVIPGLCCFNYKVIDDNPYLLEINPRFGGSLSSFFFSFIRQLKFEERVHISHRIKSLFADRNIRKAG